MKQSQVRHISEGVNFLGYEIRQADAKKLLKQKSKGGTLSGDPHRNCAPSFLTI